MNLVHQATGELATAVQVLSANGKGRWMWVPLAGGGERRALMAEVALVFTAEPGYERDQDGADADVGYLPCDDDSNY
ncbi:hypothetical protein V2A60_005758 [Cordyceps javanica]